MTNDIIIADIDCIVEFHCNNLFGHLGTEVIAQAAKYMTEHLQYMFECDFLKQCTLCGGNWAAMLMSGIKYWMPEVYDAMPERDYSMTELVSLVYNQLLIASLPELVVRICFEELDMDMDELAWSLGVRVDDWLAADDNYAPVSC